MSNMTLDRLPNGWMPLCFSGRQQVVVTGAGKERALSLPWQSDGPELHAFTHCAIQTWSVRQLCGHHAPWLAQLGQGTERACSAGAESEPSADLAPVLG